MKKGRRFLGKIYAATLAAWLVPLNARAGNGDGESGFNPKAEAASETAKGYAQDSAAEDVGDVGKALNSKALQAASVMAKVALATVDIAGTIEDPDIPAEMKPTIVGLQGLAIRADMYGAALAPETMGLSAIPAIGANIVAGYSINYAKNLAKQNNSLGRNQ